MFALISYYRHYRRCGHTTGCALRRAWQLLRHGF